MRRVGLVEEYEVDSGEGDYHLGVGLMIRMILLAEGRMFWAEVTSSRTGPALLQRVCSEDVNIERENGNRSDTAGLTLANWTTCQQARGKEAKRGTQDTGKLSNVVAHFTTHTTDHWIAQSTAPDPGKASVGDTSSY